MKSTIFFFALFLTTTLFAQTGGSLLATDPVSLSMGNAYTSSLRGIAAIGKNPALLSADSFGKTEFSIMAPLPDLSLRAGNNFLTVDDYNYFFGGSGLYDEEGKEIGRTFTEEDKSRFRGLLSDGGIFGVEACISIVSVAFQPSYEVGVFGLSINEVINGRADIPQSFANLLLGGNEVNSVYNFNDASANAWWLREYSLSYARDINIDGSPFKDLSVGISLSYITGFAYFGIERLNTSLTTDEHGVITGTGDLLAYSSFSPSFEMKYDFDSLRTDEGNFKFSPFPKNAGSGIGFDIGFFARLDSVWSFGLSLTDIGSVNWNGYSAQWVSNSAIYVNDILDKAQRDSLFDDLKGKGSFIDEFSTSLPTALHFGTSLSVDKLFPGDIPGKLSVAVDYHQGFNNMPGNTKEPRFSLGTSWDPQVSGIPTIRTGIAFGGRNYSGWSFGIGYCSSGFDWNIGTADMQYLFSPSKTKRLSLAMGVVLRF